ncbi:MAG: gamma-glutamylcyclotransferase family protein [Pseudomonadota bacterium]
MMPPMTDTKSSSNKVMSARAPTPIGWGRRGGGAPPIPLLFVYGTLMRTAPSPLGRAERHWLAHVSVDLGPAIAAGVLINRGGYPAFIPDYADQRAHCASPRRIGRPAQVVTGRLLRLRPSARVLARLDRYEEADAPVTCPDYRRVVMHVLPLAQAAAPVAAWIYIAAFHPWSRGARGPRIASGYFRGSVGG